MIRGDVRAPSCSRLRRVEQRISLVTLGVSDYPRAKAFYEALGWSAAMEIQETVAAALRAVRPG